jgi:hypothetical protein
VFGALPPRAKANSFGYNKPLVHAAGGKNFGVGKDMPPKQGLVIANT